MWSLIKILQNLNFYLFLSLFSYYPLYPPYIKDELTTNKSSNSSDHTPYMDNLPEVNMDMLLAYEKGHVTLPVKPDLLILPSTLKPFVKVSKLDTIYWTKFNKYEMMLYSKKLSVLIQIMLV